MPGFWGPGYLVVLAVVSGGAALLSLGLVQRWGEVFPRRVPLVGLLYLPLVAWAPLLAVLTLACQRRRRAG